MTRCLGRLIGSGAGALVLVLLVVIGCSSSNNDRALPDVELELLGGGTYDVQQTGQPRALNLWATWCAPCRAELPAFDQVAARVTKVDIVGINVGDSGSDAAELIDELGVDFVQVLDPNASIQQALRITGMPSTVFVDSDGNVVKVHSGELDAQELEADLADLFGETFDRQ